jgi:hypothetical protein
MKRYELLKGRRAETSVDDWFALAQVVQLRSLEVDHREPVFVRTRDESPPVRSDRSIRVTPPS